jgi:hypothetical protein
VVGREPARLGFERRSLACLFCSRRGNGTFAIWSSEPLSFVDRRAAGGGKICAGGEFSERRISARCKHVPFPARGFRLG